jgi:uncharacterized protein (TIGR02646 family)
MAKYRHGTYAAMVGDASVRAALHTEQRGLCAYCERRLRHADAADHQTRVEHFHPQHGADANPKACRTASGTKDLSKADTAWSNLLLCCNGKVGRNDECCDRRKRNTDICDDFKNPKALAAERLIKISATGEAIALESILPPAAQHVVDDVLGLNACELKIAREERFKATQREIFLFRSAKGFATTKALKSAFADRLRLRAWHGEVEYASVNLTLADRLDPLPAPKR